MVIVNMRYPFDLVLDESDALLLIPILLRAHTSRGERIHFDVDSIETSHVAAEVAKQTAEVSE